MEADAETIQKIGGEAVSAYAIFGTEGETFASLAAKARRQWDSWSDSGMQVVPIVTAGWDPRPRIHTPVPWYQGYAEDGWAQTPTPQELAEHIRDAIEWVRKKSCEPNAILIYAWNENDEGGWLLPTLGTGGVPNTERLDALRKVLRIC